MNCMSRFIISVFIAVTYGALSYAGPAPMKLIVGYAALNPRVSPLWIAEEQGLFAKFGIDVQPIYLRGAPVGVYLQVYHAGIDQTTLRPAVDVEYVLLRDGKEINKQVENWDGLSDLGARITLARLIDTRGLAAGEYEIQVHIRDQVTTRTLSPSAKFTIAK